MENELEVVGTIAASKRRLQEILVEFAEEKFKSRRGPAWFLIEAERRRKYNQDNPRNKLPPLRKTPPPSERVIWQFTDLVRTIAAKANWSEIFENEFVQRTQNQRATEEVRNALWELADLRNKAFHDGEEDGQFTSHQKDRFFELAIRLLRAIGTDRAQLLYLDIMRTVYRLVPTSTVHLKMEAVQSAHNKLYLLVGEFQRFWPLINEAYQAWRASARYSTPATLDNLIVQTPLPDELPLPESGELGDWMATAKIFERNVLWNFVQEIYPPKDLIGNQPASRLLSEERFAAFDTARRQIAYTLDLIGTVLKTEKLTVEQIPGLHSHAKLLILSTYLAFALVLRTQNTGPDKSGMFFLGNAIWYHTRQK